MADNVILSAGTADGVTLATDDIGGTHYQIVKISFGALDTATPASSANPLPVVQTGTLNVGTVTTVTTVAAVTAISNALPAGANAIGKLAANSGVDIGDVDVTSVPADPFGANADAASATGSISAKLRFIAGTGIPITGTVAVTQSGAWSLSANQSTNVAQLAGTTTDTNSGVKSAGTLRVVLATDQPALTNKLLVTPDSVALPANQSVNCSQINGVTVLMGNGNTGTGSQRVTIASDNTAFSVNAVQSGTWTVQPGNTANTTPWLASLRPGTSGGLSIFHLVSAATTNATNLKASAGQVFGWYIYNSNAAARKVVFHNTAGTPTAGASVIFAIMIPPSSAANVFTDAGIAFATGIAITTVTDLTDAGSTAVALNDLIINIFYA